MVRLWVVAAVVLVGCSKKEGAVPRAPDAPVLPHGFRAPTLRCEVEVPPGD